MSKKNNTRKKKNTRKKAPAAGPIKMSVQRLRVTCPDLKLYTNLVVLGYRKVTAPDGRKLPDRPEVFHDFEDAASAGALAHWVAESLKRQVDP